MHNPTRVTVGPDQLDHSDSFASELFDQVVEQLPGSSYIGDKWRQEPRVLVVVDQSGEHWVATAALSAFRYQQVPEPMCDNPDRWMAIMPQFAAKVLEMFASFADTELDRVEITGIDPGSANTVWCSTAHEMAELDVLQLTATLFGNSGWMELDAAVSTADELLETAQRHNTTWRNVLELVDDIDNVDLEALDDICAVTFGSHTHTAA